MRQWNTLFQKELKENWRNRKWVWVPLVFMVISVMDILTYYFLPEIIEMTGELPEGTVFEIPELTAVEAMATGLQSFGMYGIVILALMTMGMISQEKKSGLTELMLVKPIKYSHYISSKWASMVLLIFTSTFLGLSLAWYYVNLLFGSLDFSVLLLMVLFYSIWFCFFLSVSIFFNTIFHSPGAVAASTIGTFFVMGILDTLLGHKLTLFPNQISNYVHELIMTGETPNEIWGTSIIIIGLILLLFWLSVYIFKHRVVVK